VPLPHRRVLLFLGGHRGENILGENVVERVEEVAAYKVHIRNVMVTVFRKRAVLRFLSETWCRFLKLQQRASKVGLARCVITTRGR
jgi:hypothetical protein